MKLRVVQTVELTDAEFYQAWHYALELGLSVPTQKSQKRSRRLLVSKLLRLYGQAAIDTIKERMAARRRCVACGSDLEEYGVGEWPNYECTHCGHKAHEG